MKFDKWFEDTYSAFDYGKVEWSMRASWNAAIEQVAFLLEDYGTAICGCEGTVRTNTEFYDQLADDIRKRFLTTN